MEKSYHFVRDIDSVIESKTRSTYRGDADHREWVISKPMEAFGLLKWKIRIIKARYVLTGKADAFTYSKYQ